MADRAGGPEGDIRVVVRCTQILGMFSREVRAVRLKDVAAELDLGRTTVYRYLTSMASAGLLERVDEGYALGPLAAQLGALALTDSDVVDIAGPYLRELSDAAGETSILAVWGDRQPVVVRTAEPFDRSLHISVRVGQTLGADAAQSAVFAAYGADGGAVADELAARDGVTAQRVRDRIRRTAQTGIAVSDTVTSGTRGIAVPVFDRDGDVAATIALLGTVHTLPGALDSAQATELRGTAARLSRALGYSGAVAAAGPSGGS
ncbi:IclR family transcriptional regulator [Microbacterium elymi]|uniref:Helix-turn-helix domain-containing protein n=1 Tax=Microbacterium elymi TaxID=2909587 RepID=A0ABY5NMN5_9MICO|nr:MULTISPECIES: helix-turn-helix domain-containing protein [Microbacterium]UUT36447.1 helix-turn-helix domain-containing protein [Microbacterium elymi]